jgi:importin subunit beta-1
MTKVDILQISDTVMTLLLSLLSTTGAGQTGGVQEDAILTIGAIVESLGDVFEKYMNALFPFLLLTLKNYQDVQVCLAAIGLVGDLCRSISIQIFPYTNDIMQILVDELSVIESEVMNKFNIIMVECKCPSFH